VAVVEKGLAALESLLFAKYQMYRNVYWHHAVRSATAMYKRVVGDALRSGALSDGSIVGFTDEGLLDHLALTPHAPLVSALRERRLYKRALEWPASDLPDGACEWIATDRPLAVAVEDDLAAQAGMRPGELILDYPAKTQMLGLDIPVLRRSGRVERLTSAGWEGSINLPSLSDELYRSARWLRVFTARPVALPAAPIHALLTKSPDAVRSTIG
jgi:hypothetical protein